MFQSRSKKKRKVEMNIRNLFSKRSKTGQMNITDEEYIEYIQIGAQAATFINQYMQETELPLSNHFIHLKASLYPTPDTFMTITVQASEERMIIDYDYIAGTPVATTLITKQDLLNNPGFSARSAFIRLKCDMLMYTLKTLLQQKSQ